MKTSKNIKDQTIEITKALDSIFSFEDDAEKFDFEKSVLQQEMLFLIQDLMDKKGMKRGDLAQELGVSDSFVSQLFSCDKFLNMDILAKFQRIFNIRFKLSDREVADNKPVTNYVLLELGVSRNQSIDSHKRRRPKPSYSIIQSPN